MFVFVMCGEKQTLNGCAPGVLFGKIIQIFARVKNLHASCVTPQRNERAVSVVELKGGLFVSEAALRLCLLLENLGHALTAKEGKLLVSNGAALTAEQRAQIVELRLHLLTIAGVIAEQELHPPTYSRGDAAH